MCSQRPRRAVRGQSLVEYTLIIALVALAVLIVAALLGLAVQRAFGVTAGALGAEAGSSSPNVIEITTAQCIAVQSSNLTGLWVVGNTSADISTLTGSTDRAVGVGIDGLASPVEENGPNGFKFHPLLSYTADISVCPKSVVIQADDGSIAVSPVTAEVVP